MCYFPGVGGLRVEEGGGQVNVAHTQFKHLLQQTDRWTEGQEDRPTSRRTDLRSFFSLCEKQKHVTMTVQPQLCVCVCVLYLSK